MKFLRSISVVDFIIIILNAVLLEVRLLVRAKLVLGPGLSGRSVNTTVVVVLSRVTLLWSLRSLVTPSLTPNKTKGQQCVEID